MDWSDIKPWVAKVAPMLGTALGGPLGTMAGEVVAQALGVKDASPDSIKTAIATGSLNGDQIIALKKAEQDFAIQMESMEIKSVQDLENIAYQDRASARTREIEVKDWTPRILAYGVTAGFFGLLWYLLKWAPPSDNRDVLNIMLGSLGTAFIGVINYYFGSSKSSSTKDKYLYHSTPSTGAPGTE